MEESPSQNQADDAIEKDKEIQDKHLKQFLVFSNKMMPEKDNLFGKAVAHDINIVSSGK